MPILLGAYPPGQITRWIGDSLWSVPGGLIRSCLELFQSGVDVD